MMWPDRRLLDLFKIEHPIVLAPMAGAVDAALAIAVAEAGGLGSLPVALLNEQQMRAQMEKVRTATRKSINLNFFCHTPPVPNNAREHAWREALKPYYVELGIDPAAPVPPSNRTPFDAALCAAVERHQAGSGELPLRLAGSVAAQAREGGGLSRDEFGNHGGRSAVAGKEWLRCGDRARLRGRRPPRHVLD